MGNTILKCYPLLPFKKWEKENKKYPMMATMAAEGGARREAYLRTGCNSFKNGKSQPMGFWTEQDVLEYIATNNLEIASIYGDVIKDDKQMWQTTGEKRTGCVFCGFGVHLEKEPNRFQRLKETHPKLHNYCINKLNMGEVLDYIGVDY